MLASRGWPAMESTKKAAERLCWRGVRLRGVQAMKIDSVEAIPVEIPLNKVFSGSGYRVESRAGV